MRKILVDNRRGSREIAPLLWRMNVPCEVTRLEFGDFAFSGNGPKGEVMVGVERKTVMDLVGSLNSGRLGSRQLPGMVRTYPYRWILIEGLWRPGRDGRVEVYREFWEKPTKSGNGRMVLGAWFPAQTQLSWFQLAGRVANLQVKGACWTAETISPGHTAALLQVLFHWWGKDWKVHRGHLQLEKGLIADKVLYSKPSYPRLFANTLPQLGWEKSKSVAKRFHTIEAMVLATEKDWMSVPGVGKKLGALFPKIIRGSRDVARSREE